MIPRLHWREWLTFRTTDIVLAASDVEGNFLVVKVSSLAKTLIFRGVTNLKYHRLINIPTSSRACSSMRESCLCRAPTSMNCLLTLPRWAIPICMFFLYVYLRTRFHWTQILVCFFPRISKIPPSPALQGALICVLGLGLLVGADQLTNKDWAAVNKGKGDAFMILGATLYGFSES